MGRQLSRVTFDATTHFEGRENKIFLVPVERFFAINHQDGVLNYFTMPITDGAVEGLNNKAKAISHRGHGFRTATTLILALYHCLSKLPEPQTVHRFL